MPETFPLSLTGESAVIFLFSQFLPSFQFFHRRWSDRENAPLVLRSAFPSVPENRVCLPTRPALTLDTKTGCIVPPTALQGTSKSRQIRMRGSLVPVP